MLDNKRIMDRKGAAVVKPGAIVPSTLILNRRDANKESLIHKQTVFTDIGFMKCSWGHIVISSLQSCVWHLWWSSWTYRYDAITCCQATCLPVEWSKCFWGIFSCHCPDCFSKQIDNKLILKKKKSVRSNVKCTVFYWVCVRKDQHVITFCLNDVEHNITVGLDSFEHIHFIFTVTVLFVTLRICSGKCFIKFKQI